MLLNYGVTEKKGELIVQTQEVGFLQRKHDLLQAMLEIEGSPRVGKAYCRQSFYGRCPHLSG